MAEIADRNSKRRAVTRLSSGLNECARLILLA